VFPALLALIITGRLLSDVIRFDRVQLHLWLLTGSGVAGTFGTDKNRSLTV